MTGDVWIDGYTVRAPSFADMEAVVELINVCSLAVSGEREASLEDQRSEWQMPGFDLARDTRLVLAPDGQVVGYGELWDVAEPHVRRFAFVCVHPRHAGRGIGTALNRWVEQHARETLHTAPLGVRVTLGASTVAGDEAAQALLRDRGFVPVRHFWRMAIDLDAPPPEPRWPDGVQVRLMREGDEREYFRAVDGAFEDHWGHVDQPFEQAFERWKHYALQGPQFDPGLFFLAEDGAGGQIAGGACCRPSIPEDPAMGWVNTLGVVRQYRQRGIGLALLQHAFGEFYRRGQQRVGLSVDASNLTGATRLYEKAGMHVAQEVIVFEKVLRDGEDLTTQSIEPAAGGAGGWGSIGG